MNNSAARFVIILTVIALMFPSAVAAAQGGGNTVYLPVVSKAPPPPPPAVLQVGPMGGTFPGVVVDPMNVSVVYAGSYGQGVFKSVDGGLTWQSINNGISNLFIQTISLTPDGGTLYAGTYGSGIFRSTDGGANWTAVNNGFPAPSIQNGGFIVYDIEISPTTPATLYAAIREVGTFEANGLLYGYVLKSQDSGASWTTIWNGWWANSNRGDYSYDVDLRASDGTLYLATHENGVWRLPPISGLVEKKDWVVLQSDGGDPERKNMSARNVVVAGSTIYNSIYKLVGVYKSTSDGNSGTWTIKSTGLPASALYGFALEKDPNNSATLYLGTTNSGVYKSTNSGESWGLKGLVGTYIWRFSFAPSDSQRVFSGTNGNGVQFSDNGGDSWQWQGNGVYNATISGLAVLPSQPGFIYAGTLGAGVYRSSDQGASWQRVINGLGDLNVKALLVIEGKLYAVTGTHLYVSTDGVNWSAEVTMAPSAQIEPKAAEGQFEMPFDHLLLQPEEERLQRAEPVELEENDGGEAVSLGTGKPITSAAKNSAGLWVGTAGAGIRLTVSPFCVVANDPFGQTAYALHNHNGVVWASIDKYDPDDQILKYYVMKWNPKDNICNWDTANRGILSSIKVNAFASSPSRLLAAANTGVFYFDGNADWTLASGLTGAVYAIAADPNVSGLVYAAAESGAYFSTNHGLSWQAVPRSELQGKAFVSVLVDPQNSNLVFFGSRGGSTYRWDKTLP